MKRLFPFLVFFIFSNISYGQLIITTNIAPQQLIQNYFVGNGVSISNITSNSVVADSNIGIFTNGQTTNIGLYEGIIMATGSVHNALGPNNFSGTGNATNTGTDSSLVALIPGYSINHPDQLKAVGQAFETAQTFRSLFICYTKAPCRRKCRRQV